MTIIPWTALQQIDKKTDQVGRRGQEIIPANDPRHGVIYQEDDHTSASPEVTANNGVGDDDGQIA